MIKSRRRIQKMELIAGIRVQRVRDLTPQPYNWTAVTDLSTGDVYGFSSWYTMYGMRTGKVKFENVKSFADAVKQGAYGKHFGSCEKEQRRW